MRLYVLFAALGLSALLPGVGQVAAADNLAPATFRVTLPADAKLTIDDKPTTSTSATRLFATPPLEKGKKYEYTLKAEYVRGGKTVTVQQKITLEAGRETLVDMTPEGQRGSGVYTYRVGPDGRTYYYSPEQGEGAPATIYYGPLSAEPYRVAPFSSGGSGYRPPSYGVPPSSPFYHSGQ